MKQYNNGKSLTKRQEYDYDDFEVAGHIIVISQYKVDRYGEPMEVTWNQLEWANDVENYFDNRGEYVTDVIENILQELGI